MNIFPTQYRMCLFCYTRSIFLVIHRASYPSLNPRSGLILPDQSFPFPAALTFLKRHLSGVKSLERSLLKPLHEMIFEITQQVQYDLYDLKMRYFSRFGQDKGVYFWSYGVNKKHGKRFYEVLRAF